MEDKLIPTSVRIPESVLKRIDELLDGTGKSRADFIRDAIYYYMDELEAKKKLKQLIQKVLDFIGKEEDPEKLELKKQLEALKVVINGR